MAPSWPICSAACTPLDPAPLSRALGCAGNVRRYLDAFAGRIERGSSTSWRRCSSGCGARHPPPARAAICHGDFHPQNVLVTMAAYGVLDCPTRSSPIPPSTSRPRSTSCDRARRLTSMPAALRWVARPGQPLLAVAISRSYRGSGPFDDARPRVYRVAAALAGAGARGESRAGWPGRRPTSMPRPYARACSATPGA